VEKKRLNQRKKLILAVHGKKTGYSRKKKSMDGTQRGNKEGVIKTRIREGLQKGMDRRARESPKGRA